MFAFTDGETKLGCPWQCNQDESNLCSLNLLRNLYKPNPYTPGSPFPPDNSQTTTTTTIQTIYTYQQNTFLTTTTSSWTAHHLRKVQACCALESLLHERFSLQEPGSRHCHALRSKLSRQTAKSSTLPSTLTPANARQRSTAFRLREVTKK